MSLLRRPSSVERHIPVEAASSHSASTRWSQRSWANWLTSAAAQVRIAHFRLCFPVGHQGMRRSLAGEVATRVPGQPCRGPEAQARLDLAQALLTAFDVRDSTPRTSPAPSEPPPHEPGRLARHRHKRSIVLLHLAVQLAVGAAEQHIDPEATVRSPQPAEAEDKRL